MNNISSNGSAVLLNKGPRHITVTEIKQYTLPASIHEQDIRDAIVRQENYFKIDFLGFHCAKALYGTAEKTRDEVFNKAVEHFKTYGVRIDFGTYYHDGWIPVGLHTPATGMTVLVACPQGIITAVWHGDEKTFARDGYEVQGVTHWQHVPSNPSEQPSLWPIA